MQLFDFVRKKKVAFKIPAGIRHSAGARRAFGTRRAPDGHSALGARCFFITPPT